MGIAPLQEDDRVVHPHESREAEGLHRRGPVCDVHVSQERERRRRPRMDPLDGTLGRTQELRQGVGLPGALGQGVGKTLGMGGEVVGLSQAHPGSHYRVNVLRDHVEEFREIRDQDVHYPVLKPGQVQLHVHRADDLLEGYPPHAPH